MKEAVDQGSFERMNLYITQTEHDTMDSPFIPPLSDGCALRRRNGRLLACRDGREEPVRAVWARPLTGRGNEVSLLSEAGVELAFVELDQVADGIRKLLEDELDDNYTIAKVTSVDRTRTSHGNYYFYVTTSRGSRCFVLRDPAHNVKETADGRMLFRDVMGNRFEIASLDLLDRRSRRAVEAVL
jgi:hypothetical protein